MLVAELWHLELRLAELGHAIVREYLLAPDRLDDSFIPSSLGRAVPQPFLVENLLLKIPYMYIFKHSYGGTLEPQTAQDAPSVQGPLFNY
jgi:hypothetical protein